MGGIENSEGLLRDVSEVESFKAAFWVKLRDILGDILGDNYDICHTQALLGEAITKESSRTKKVLVSTIKEVLDGLGLRISIKTIILLVNDALAEILTDDFEAVETDASLSVDEMRPFGRPSSGDGDCSRSCRELSAEEDLPF